MSPTEPSCRRSPSRRIAPFPPVLEELRQQVRIDPAAPATARKLAAGREAVAAELRRMEQGIAAMLKAVATAVPPRNAWLSPEELKQRLQQL
ncbi:hypothetical protein NZK32_09110 [Cyanobium sp. FGCU-52]|nr:hypothetical protein [Cyanobium sp. FGCU52]